MAVFCFYANFRLTSVLPPRCFCPARHRASPGAVFVARTKKKKQVQREVWLWLQPLTSFSFLAAVCPPGSLHTFMETFANKDQSKVTNNVDSLRSSHASPVAASGSCQPPHQLPAGSGFAQGPFCCPLCCPFCCFPLLGLLPLRPDALPNMALV